MCNASSRTATIGADSGPMVAGGNCTDGTVATLGARVGVRFFAAFLFFLGFRFFDGAATAVLLTAGVAATVVEDSVIEDSVNSMP